MSKHQKWFSETTQYNMPICIADSLRFEIQQLSSTKYDTEFTI